LLKVDLISPTGAELKTFNSEKVVAPSAMGELTILEGHRDMLCTLSNGSLLIDGYKEKLMIYGGVMEISNGSEVHIAADRMVNTSSLNKDQIEKDIKAIETRLTTESLDKAEYKKLMKEYQYLKAELSSIL